MIQGSRIIPAALLLAVVSLAGCGKEQEQQQSQPAVAPSDAQEPAPAQPATQDNAVTALQGGLQATDRTTLQCNLDLASGNPVTGPVTLTRANAASFEGWAFAAGQPSLTSPVIVFEGAAGTFQAGVKGGNPRPDVAASFGLSDVQNAGFTGLVNVSALPAGEYQLWLASGAQSTDKACDLKAKVVIGD